MSEDTDPSGYTDFIADETFVVKCAEDRFGNHAPGVVVAAGDDAAVLDAGAGEFVVTSCDCAVEGVHFQKRWFRIKGLGPEVVGARAVLCSASDIAAMGAVPKTVLVSMGISEDTTRKQVSALFDGVQRACDSIGAVVTGGNTVSSPAVFVDIHITGLTENRRFVRNRGSQVGDAVFVTGEIGAETAALKTLDDIGLTEVSPLPPWLKRFCFPSPRISTGLALCRAGVASAMTDVSDGLIADACRVAEFSQTGADIFLEKIPLSRGFGGDVCTAATSGGDYELVFTAPPSLLPQVEKISRETGVRITEIGAITNSKTRIFHSEHELHQSVLQNRGYVHNRAT